MSPPPANSFWRHLKNWLALALFGVLWVDLVLQLSSHWESNEQYAYGWFVPFLAASLFVRRWLTRPEMSTPRSAEGLCPAPLVPGWVWLMTGLMCLILLPVRMAHEINADWPTCSWMLTLGVVGLTLSAIFAMGRRSWVGHFAFPVCFILVAVAWPFRLEHGLTQGLMRLVAGLTVEILGWFDIPAFQRGNLIEVATGVVGIDEACSGIRSFQSTLMAALFLGEFHRLVWRRRLVLLGGGVGLAFCFNIVRTLFLTWTAASGGIESIHKWHDPAGLMIFFASFGGLFVLARILRGAAAPPAPVAPPPAPPIPRGLLVSVGCWAVFMVVATEAWYRSHQIETGGVFRWSAGFPTNKPGFAEVELDDRTRNLLRFDVSGTGKWRESDGTDWTGFFFRWNPKSIGAILSARQHRPEECLPAAGLRQVEDGGLVKIWVGGLPLPFRKYTYEAEGGRVHVFFCQWEDGTEKPMGMWASMKSDRLRAALVGRRRLGQQSLEMILSGYPTLAMAEQALRKRLPDLVRIEKAASSGVQPHAAALLPSALIP